MNKVAPKKAGAVVSKNTGVMLLLIAVVLAITMAIYALNYFQAPKVTQVERRESASGGEVSLTFVKPSVATDSSGGSVSLTVLPSGG